MRSQQAIRTAAPAATGTAARDAFTSTLGVLAATLGSAVGLGNIWKFPSLTGASGGAAFLVAYLICTLLVGLPVMIAEITLGRAARADAITTFQKLAPRRQPWWLVGAAGVAAAFLILAFYTEVAAWVFAYIARAASGALQSTDPATMSAAFGGLVGDPVQALLWQWLVLALVGAIIAAGVAGGIERVTRRLMPVLFVLLLVLVARALTLPGAAQGLAFLFVPDFSKLTGEVWLIAMGLAFFKLSVGMGTMMTYGSYFRDDQRIPSTAARVMLADLLVSLLAGVAIFPAVFTFGFEPAAGPSLLFITIPAVFAGMPLGQLFLVLFFVLAAIAATGAMLSLLEVPVAALAERTRLSRPQATLLTVLVLAAIGAPAALSSSLLAEVKLFDKTFFDLYDWASSNLLLPLGGLLISLFTGWVWGGAALRQALSNGGALSNGRVAAALSLLLKVVTPALVLLVLLQGLGWL